MSLTSSSQTHGLSFRRTRDERAEKYSYPSIDCDEVDTVFDRMSARGAHLIFGARREALIRKGRSFERGAY